MPSQEEAGKENPNSSSVKMPEQLLHFLTRVLWTHQGHLTWSRIWQVSVSVYVCCHPDHLLFAHSLSLSRPKRAIQTKLPESNSSKLGWTDTHLLSEWFSILESWLVLSPGMFELLLLSDLHGFVSHMIWKVWQTNKLCIYVTWFWGCSCVWNRRKENVGSSWKYKWKIRIWKFMQCRYECL